MDRFRTEVKENQREILQQHVGKIAARLWGVKETLP